MDTLNQLFQRLRPGARLGVAAATPSYLGFVNGDSAASFSTAPTCTSNTTSSTPPGIYVSTCSGAAASNYTTSYVSGTVTITAAPAPVQRFTDVPPTNLFYDQIERLAGEGVILGFPDGTFHPGARPWPPAG